MTDIFEWSRLLMNDLPGKFVLEVFFRSTVMFLIILVAIRSLGKRGVKQISIFEIVIIIALGSAAGDPMFYEDVGIIPALCVFITITLLYRGVTWCTGKSKWFEGLIEGKPVCLIEEGKFAIDNFKKEGLAQDEFFSELRRSNVEHLGQVRNAIIETSGGISIFYYADEDVKPGLPIIPADFNKRSRKIEKTGMYSCTFCGYTQGQKAGTAQCPACHKDEWVKSIKTHRLA